MITSFRVPQDKIGLYSGLGEGIMMLVEAANATNWARLGNKYGRRPCILWGFSVTAIAMPILGFGGSVWQIVLARALSEYEFKASSCFCTLSPSDGLDLFSGSESWRCSSQDLCSRARSSHQPGLDLLHNVPCIQLWFPTRHFSRRRARSSVWETTLVVGWYERDLETGPLCITVLGGRCLVSGMRFRAKQC